MIQSGEIIFWNKVLGFIKYDNSEKSIFFHKSNLDKNYKNVSLLDKVKFEVSKTQKGIHKGKPLALNVEFISNGNFKEHQRTIGKLNNWNSKYGFLKSPQLDKEVFLFHTRLLKANSNAQSGDYFTFSPIKSTKNPNQLFAFFAYPLKEEDDIEFLIQQKSENNIPLIEKIISSLIRGQVEKTVDEKFKSELIEILGSDIQNFYTQIVELIGYYKIHFDYTPTFDILSQEVPKVYQIQLLENDIISDYDLETMIDYFHNSTADTKRTIINKFEKEDKIIILRNHFKFLFNKGKIKKVNNDLKTFLDIVYRNEDTREPEIYEDLKKIVLENIEPKECANLWFNGYIDDLPESYIVDNFEINNVLKLQKDNETHQRIVFKIYENYLLNFAKEKNFESDYTELIQYLRNFREQFENKFEQIAKASIFQLSTVQKLILWVFEPSLPFEGLQFVRYNWDKLNVYFLVKLTINEGIDLAQDLTLEISNSISEQSLIEFALSNEWNNLIIPVDEPDRESFITDVNTFIDKYERLDISLNKIADAIYDSLPLYKIHHLRLWLWGYVHEKRYDYIGFRERFNDLIFSEQKMFRKKGDNQIKEEIAEGEILEVIPCTNIISTEGNLKVYKAVVENIYFRDGKIQLRTENKDYTEIFHLEFASSGLNRIPKTSYYNQFEFILKVKEKTIIEIEGFDDFFAEIHTGEINKALGKITPPDTSRDSRNKSYVEDWKLRKKVIDYLNEAQYEGLPKLVNEPKSRYRRLEIGTEIDVFEKTHLYSIRTNDGYGIIWENIDLTEDRATFIFKALDTSHKLQLSKIANSIVSSGQLRSTLISLKSNDRLQIFKDNLGYVAKIHKQRGKNQPFSNWKEKLEKSLLLPIPDLPTPEQIQSLENWQAEMPHSPRIRKVVKKIDESSIKTKDIDFGEPKLSQPETKNLRLTPNAKKSILEKLKEINQIIQNK